jgi:RHS repeat-associated protein
LQTRTTPEQGATSYAYNADDAVQTVTDARGASSTFGYNNRYLVTGITYGVSGTTAAPTSNISFAYDAAGNRTSMTDGLGSVSYSYNTLSQLTSETRTFTGVGSFALSYGYNLAGQLTSVTNPWNALVGYLYDKMGRLTSVSGSGYAGVNSYASSLTYRAFGLKGMSYGNGRTLALQYDNRMRVTDWTVGSVLGWQYGYADVGENTGRVMFAKNTASSTANGQRDDTLDRSYDYDHLGRLIVSHTGYEARLHMNRQQTGDPTTYGPYSQAYGYDQLGNMNVRYGWGGWDAGYVNWTPSYTDNRLNTNPATGAAMQYDSSGNLTNDGYQSYTYDATGQQASASATTLSQGYDGDRLRVKKTESGVTTYYLRSSVLGGQPVAEINSSGSFTCGYVYAGGQMLAIQQNNQVSWVHQDPVTKSQRVTNIYGSVVSTTDLDPWGGETASSSNQAFQPHRFTTYERDGNSGDEAMMRRYTGKWHRFDQPDPYDGSYSLGDPQSFNRYAYTQNDPVNFVDPSGLEMVQCGYGDFGPIYCDNGVHDLLFILHSRFVRFTDPRDPNIPDPTDPPPQNPQPTPAPKPCFNINVNNKVFPGLNDTIEGIIADTFAQAGVGVVFNSPNSVKAGHSFTLNFVNKFPANVTKAVLKDYPQGAFGATLEVNGKFQSVGWVGVDYITGWLGKFDIPLTTVIAAGVGAHEASHKFLNLHEHNASGQGLMRTGNSYQSSSDWEFTQSQKQQLKKLCP